MVARAVKAVLKKQRTLVANLQKDQQNAEKAAQLKHDAYILQGNLRHIQKGDTQFCGVDFEGSPVVIALNPQLDGVANMQAMFEKASRLGKAIEQIEERLLGAMMQEERLVELQQQVTVAPLDTLDELMGQLSQMNVQVVQRVGKRGQTVRLPYRQYPVFGAHTARVGRSARDNDALTLKHAGPNDLWLHVRGLPGSHVVVPLGRGEEAGQELLLDAAHLAAHFSSARNDDHVEVTWTLRKYVQKPRGTAPGAVRLLKEKTFILRVDPQRLEELLSSQK
jgi:predicted ribosome quality control (RQC) complex YloA/Tae2 family protein